MAENVSGECLHLAERCEGALANGKQRPTVDVLRDLVKCNGLIDRAAGGFGERAACNFFQQRHTSEMNHLR